MLLRETVVLEAYQRAREGGDKHEIALMRAMEAGRKFLPNVPLSMTAVKMILAEFMSTKLGRDSMIVTKSPGHTLPDGRFSPSGSTYTAGFAARPNYPRANARCPKDKQSTDD